MPKKTMTPKRLQSASTLNKLASIGKVLDQADAMSIRSQIDAWCDANPDLLGAVWNFMRSGLAGELNSDSGRRTRIATSTTKWGNMSQAAKSKLLRHEVPAYNVSMIRSLKKADPKIVNKLFYFMIADVPLSPVDFKYQDEAEAWVTARVDVVGQRLEGLKIDADSKVDWQGTGVYKIISAKSFDTDGRPEIDPEGAQTHVMHTASGLCLDIAKDIDVPADREYSIHTNWDEMKAEMTDGRGRLKVPLFECFKGDKWFNYKQRGIDKCVEQVTAQCKDDAEHGEKAPKRKSSPTAAASSTDFTTPAKKPREGVRRSQLPPPGPPCKTA